MSSGENAAPEVFGNGTFVKSFLKEDKNDLKSLPLEEDEVVANESFVESLQRGEDVFTNGSLPKSLTSAPLLPLYQIVVNKIFPRHHHHRQLSPCLLHSKLIKRTHI